MPYREVLGGTYDLRWNKNRKCYTGNMKINGLKIENLTKFCEIMELKMAVDGVLITSDVEEEEETQIKEVDFDDSQLGKIGNKKILIKKVFYKTPHAMWRFYGYYGGMNSVGNMSTYGMFADDSTFEVIPPWQNKMQAMAYEDAIYTRNSHYSFELINNQLRIYPAAY